MTLSEEQRQNYLDKKGCVCPFCESKSVVASPLEADGMDAWCTVECYHCGEKWEDEYNLVNVQDVREHETVAGMTGLEAHDFINDQEIHDCIEFCEVRSRKDGYEMTMGQAHKLWKMAEKIGQLPFAL